MRRRRSMSPSPTRETTARRYFWASDVRTPNVSGNNAPASESYSVLPQSKITPLITAVASPVTPEIQERLQLASALFGDNSAGNQNSELPSGAAAARYVRGSKNSGERE